MKLWYLKDETNSIQISKLVGLRSKLYSMIYGNEEKKTEKEIKILLTKYVMHERYKEALF